MTMITPSYLGETIEYSSLHACRSTLEDPTLIQATQPADIVLCEGLLLSEDVKWTSQMKDVHCFFLTTSLERCLSQIKARRAEAGNEKPLNEYNTSNRVGVIEKARQRLLDLGVDCRRCSTDQCPELIMNLLRSKSHGSGTELDHHSDSGR